MDWVAIARDIGEIYLFRTTLLKIGIHTCLSLMRGTNRTMISLKVLNLSIYFCLLVVWKEGSKTARGIQRKLHVKRTGTSMMVQR